MKRKAFLFLIIFSIIGKAQKSSIDGEYKLNCKNPYQILDISKNKVYISLYNNIYINGKIKKKNDFYELFYSYTEPVPKWEKKIDSTNISKVIPFATIKKIKGSVVMKWFGLYNSKFKKREFVKDAIFVEDNNNHSTTIFLKKCD